MSAGLFGLLDDVAALAKLAAASVDDVGAAAGRATAKAAGVVIDDTAVTPQYVHGVTAEREIPIVKKIAWGSLRNKLLIILPVALVLSQWAEWALAPILLVGGCYLAYEGAEKVWERLHGAAEHGAAAAPPTSEKDVVTGAVRTDLILSTEIMLIALDQVADESFWSRLLILVVVAIALTIGVYGVVGLIVKMDDAGLALAGRRSMAAQRVGRGLVRAMPWLLEAISVVGIAAMLWVGGHILVNSVHEMGWHGPHDLLHRIVHAVHGGVQGWVVETILSALVGAVVGAVVLAVLHVVPRRRTQRGGHSRMRAESSRSRLD
jgi:predicted DNA repair protein MutK